MKIVNGSFVPEDRVYHKVTSEILKDLIVEAARLKRDELEGCFEGATDEERQSIYVPKNWKRSEKIKVDDAMRETLRQWLLDLPSEDIYARYFRFETEAISWILGETYATKNRVLLISIEDQ